MLHNVGTHKSCIDFKGATVDIFNPGTHIFQYIHHRRNITDVRYVFYSANILRQNGSGENGNYRIFRTADRNFSGQALTAGNNKLIQRRFTPCFLFSGSTQNKSPKGHKNERKNLYARYTRFSIIPPTKVN